MNYSDETVALQHSYTNMVNSNEAVTLQHSYTIMADSCDTIAQMCPCLTQNEEIWNYH